MNSPLGRLLARRAQRGISVPSYCRLDPPRGDGCGPVVIRLATAGDRFALDYLAELDSAARPAGATLIGELGSRPVVAVEVSDVRVIADPFVATADVAELVRLRARQFSGARRNPKRGLRSRGRRARYGDFSIRDRSTR